MKKKEKKTIKTKKGINPFTGAILTIPAEKNDHQKLEEEVFEASKLASRDVQKYLIASDKQQERALERAEWETPGPCPQVD